MSAMMNFAPPCSKFGKYDNIANSYNSKLLTAVTEVSEASMRNAAPEAIAINDASNDKAAAFDGTWHNRGHTSMNGERFRLRHLTLSKSLTMNACLRFVLDV